MIPMKTLLINEKGQSKYSDGVTSNGVMPNPYVHK